MGTAALGCPVVGKLTCRAALDWADEGVRPYVVRGDQFHLPDPAGVFLDHRLTGFAVECFLELGHVLHHAVQPILPWRVRIHADQHAGKLGTPLFAPGAAVSQEEALFWSVVAGGL